MTTQSFDTRKAYQTGDTFSPKDGSVWSITSSEVNPVMTRRTGKPYFRVSAVRIGKPVRKHSTRKHCGVTGYHNIQCNRSAVASLLASHALICATCLPYCLDPLQGFDSTAKHA